MTDERRRSLEREVTKSPDDQAARLRLELEWVHSGLGWHGERMDSGAFLRVGDERGVYEFAGSIIAGGQRLERGLELVYVSGGSMACAHGAGGALPDCEGAPRVSVDPFYVGRFPVTWDEFRAFCDATESERLPLVPAFLNDLREEHGRHPVVNARPEEAQAFCSWLGLRLPTRNEWLWAAKGPGSDPEKDCPTPGKLTPVCRQCYGRPCVGPKPFPWGHADPTPETCAAADPDYHHRRYQDPRFASPLAVILGSTAPVTVERCAKHDRTRQVHKEPKWWTHDCKSEWAFRPARPAGASWCGAQDLAGNVHQLVSDFTAWGGSFRSRMDTLRHTGPIRVGETRDDIGFRVAVSAQTGGGSE